MNLEQDIWMNVENVTAAMGQLVKLGNEMAFQIEFDKDDRAKRAAAYAWREATGSLVETYYE